MKKMVSLSTALLLVFGLFATSAPQASAVPDLSAWGRDAVEQIATCINSSGQKDVVNVLFLIDESGSLGWNDKQNLRVEGLKTALDEFASIAKYRPYFTINRAFSTFADDFKVIDGKGWAELTEKSLPGDKEWIDSNVPELTSGQTTDYARALDGAYKYMKPKIAANSCDLLVWFTDGALNVGPSAGATPTVAATEKAYQQICAVNPRTGAPTGGEAIIDKFRKSGINIQGILLRNADVIANPDKYKKTKAYVDDESRGMTYFTPIVEYSGNVDTAYFNGSSQRDIKCGSPSGAKGVVTVVGDPIDIIWPPTEFECITSSGRVLEPKSGFVNIDPGFSRFKASALKNGFSLKNGAGQEIANSKGASVGDVEVSYFGADDAAVSVSGNIAPNTALAPGKWKFVTKDYERSVFCGYLDLAVEIKNDPCYLGEDCSFNGAITRNGREVNFAEFKSSKLRYGFVDSGSQAIAYSALPFDDSGKFKGTFNAAGHLDAEGFADVIVTLDVVTKSGYEFTFSAIQHVQPLPPGLYPEVNPNPINQSDFTAPLDGKRGTATAPISIKGPSRTNGEVCFSDLEVRTDPNPNRVNGYQATLNGDNLKDIDCIKVNVGQSIDYTLEIKNPDAENGIVSGFIPVVFKSDGQPDIAGQVPVTFESKIKINGTRFWIIFALCMFLGLALPLAMLKILQVRAARISVSALSKATTPVILSASGGFVTIRRAEKVSHSDIFTESDFEGFMHLESKEKQIQIGSETLRGNAPINPFAAPRAILATSPGFIVASSDIWSTNKHGLERHETVASLNPAFAMHLTLSESALAALKKMNQSGDAPDFPIEGNITGLLNFNSADPVTQVAALNMKLSTDAGWLNNLLKIEDMPITTPPAGGGDIGVGGWDQPNKPSDDGWGTTPTITPASSGGSSAAAPKISDDGWGSSTTSSNDDWGTSGNSGGSSSKNDDW
jgi:hypothetical protein